jgi:lysophospholipase L1-like esterase
MQRALQFSVACCICFIATPLAAAGEFQFRNGDRVVLVGNTLIEREQLYGYWETLLTALNPDKNITFRNLGWSGDTVFGEARAGFGTPADGFRHLKEDVLAFKPTVLILGYGGNESFAGPAGLPRFLKGLDTLLDAMAPTEARVVLLSPLRHERLPAPLPDPTEHNKNLELYRDALREVALKRGYWFLDLYGLVPREREAPGARAVHLTDNGIHLTAYGYWRSAFSLARGLGFTPASWKITFDLRGNRITAEGADVGRDPAAPMRLNVKDSTLPFSPSPKVVDTNGNDFTNQRILRIHGLEAGDYLLKIDGRAVTVATAQQWQRGVYIAPPTEASKQVDRLRQLIIEKNRLYFHRWRPENETYLFGFRKYEQGQNAVEVPRFDPLVQKLDAQIAKLRTPVVHKYEIVPNGGANK